MPRWLKILLAAVVGGLALASTACDNGNTEPPPPAETSAGQSAEASPVVDLPETQQRILERQLPEHGYSLKSLRFVNNTTVLFSPHDGSACTITIQLTMTERFEIIQVANTPVTELPADLRAALQAPSPHEQAVMTAIQAARASGSLKC